MSLPCLGRDGTAMSITAVQRPPEISNFLASWCASCADELSLLAGAYGRISDQVLILGVDSKDDRDAALDAIAWAGVIYPQVLDPPGALELKLDVVRLPFTIFVDASGRVVDRVPGPLTADRLAAGLARLGVDISLSPRP